MTDLRGQISHLSAVHLAFAAQQVQAKAELMRAEPIAIIGMACRFPGGADDPRAFWHLLQSGGDAIVEVPRDRWDIDALYDPDPQAPGKMCCRYGGFLARADLFDADFFGISPREAVGMDPQQRLLLEVAWEALEHANQPADLLFGSPTGVFVGISTSDYALLRAGLRDRRAIDAYQVSGTSLSVAAGRLSYLLGLNGPCMSVDTACSSSLVGLHLACQSLRNRESDLALAAGVGLLLASEPSINFSKAGMLAPDGRCKTFDAAADGYVRGEGCGVVVLKRLGDALADGDTVLAVVRGSAVNQDGASGGLTVPSGPSQEAAIRQAVAGAGLDPLQISYVEAHGTGTALGDPIELNALAAALCAQRPADQALRVGSVKSHIGHLEAASGIAGVIKVVLALRQRQIPPQLHFKTPNPRLDWERMPIRVAAQPEPWAPAGGRRIAGVSAFGFSGTNAHVVLEEAPAGPERPLGAQRPLHLLTLSAKSQAALQQLAQRYLRHMEAHAQPLADLCYTANSGRAQFNHRLALVAGTAAELQAQLAALQGGAAVQGVWRSPQAAPAPVRQAPLRLARLQAAGDLPQAFAHLAEAYTAGARIDWEDLYDGQACAKVDLPTYPFQRERFWLPSGADPVPTAGATAAPPIALPGQRLRLPLSSEIRFQTQLAGELPVFLADHRLFGTVVVAGATYVAMLLQAARAAFHQEAVVLEELLLQQPLTIGPDSASLLQTVIEPAVEGRAAFHVMSLDTSAADEAAWERHVTGRIRMAGDLPAAPQADLSALRAAAEAGWRTVDAAAFYDRIAAAGHQLGDSFRCIRRIWRQGRQALCLLQAPDRAGLEDGFALYPGLIDSCFQFFCIEGRRLWADGAGDPADDAQDEDATYVPFSLAQVRFSGRTTASPGSRLWCQTIVSAFDPRNQGLTGEIHLVDDQGHVLLQISGFTARKLTRDLLRQVEKPQPPQNLEHALYRQQWRALSQSATLPDAAAPGQWLIFADQGGMGQALSLRLREQGESVRLIFGGAAFRRENEARCHIDPGAPADYARLVEACSDDALPCKGIIHLWSLDSAATPPGWTGLLHLAQAFAAGPWPVQPRLWLVTRGAQAVSSPELAMDPHQALLWGLANTIRLEQPQWPWTCIDLDAEDAPDPTPLLFAAIRRAGREERLAIRQGALHGARLVPLRLPREEAWRARPDATYLITGGLGALGLATARWLASRGAAQLVLVGRSAATAAGRAQVDDLERAGVRAKILSADIAKASEVTRIMAQISGLPPLKGIVHAAGVLDDGLLGAQDEHRFRKVMAPKVEGARHLHEATRELPLDFFICYSSAAALLGAAGQANYAAANAFLDALAHARRSQGLHGLSINWGPWQVGMAAGLDARDQARLAVQGFTPIAVEPGFSVLERLLRQDETQAVVLPLQWKDYLQSHYRGAVPPFFAALAGDDAGQPKAAAAPASILRELSQAPAGQRRALLRAHVHTQVAAVLHLPPGRRVPEGEGFFDHGLDSLMAMELRQHLEADLAKPLPATLVFDYPTVTALADWLLAQIGPAAGQSVPEPAQGPGPALDADAPDVAIVNELLQLEKLLKGNG